MPHSRHDRHRRGEDRPHQHLLVETPEILETAAAADQRDHVHGGHELGGTCEGRGQFLGRAGPLHPRGHDDHLGGPPSREQRGEEIRDGRPRGACDHRDSTWECWDRPLAARREDALTFERGMQFLEPRLEAAGAHRVEPVDRELVGAAWWIELESAVADHLQAVHGLDGKQRDRTPPDHAAEKGRFILERQVDMAGRGSHQIADFAGDPDVGEPRLEVLLDARRDLRHAHGVLRRAATVGNLAVVHRGTV